MGAEDSTASRLEAKSRLVFHGEKGKGSDDGIVSKFIDIEGLGLKEGNDDVLVGDANTCGDVRKGCCSNMP